jgi:hypothetical protein
VHKISTHVHIYMKMGKGRREKKKQRDSGLNGPGGDFGPVRARAAGPDGPRVRRWRRRARGRRHERGPTCQREREGGRRWAANRGGKPVGVRENRPPTRFHGGSLLWLRFSGTGEVG